MIRSSREALIFFALTLVPAGSLQADCATRKDQPVIVTRFEIGSPALRGKLPGAARFEQEMSRSLAAALRCEAGFKFLEWSADAPPLTSRGVVHVSMVLAGPLPAPIELVFESQEGGRLREALSLGQAGLLLSAQDPHAPGLTGELWRGRLERRFSELARNQGFVQEMVRAFSFVPLVQSENLLISPTAKAIGLPVSPGRLPAGPGTQVDLDFRLRTPEEPRVTQALWVNPCLLGAREWQGLLQLALDRDAAAIGHGKSAEWSDLASGLANRIPGRTGAFLKSFVWKPPEVCGRFEAPGARP